MSSQTRQCISTIENHLHEVEQERDHALRERDVALNDVKNLVQERDSVRTEILQLNMEIAALTRAKQIPRVDRAQLAEVMIHFAMDPATLDPNYNADDYEWSSPIVDALKEIYIKKPRWSIVTTLDDRIVVRLVREPTRAMPNLLRGDDGNSYSYQSIVGYFL